MTVSLKTPWPSDTRYLHCSGLIVDLCYRQIVQPAAADLPQRLFDLLVLLMAEPHILHTRASLFERLWPGLVVEDANLTQSVWLLRKLLGDERKQWIRTVAKGGYVFEPPGPVEACMEWPPLAVPAAPVVAAPAGRDDDDAEAEALIAVGAGATPAAQEHACADPPASSVSARLAGVARFRWLALAAVVFALVVGGAMTWRWRDAARPTLAAPAPVSVALVMVRDPGNDVQWPAKLLREWVKWKLSSLPEITVLTEADLAAGAGVTPPQVLFLAAGESPDDAGRIVVRARFQEQGKQQLIEREGEPAQVSALVDAMSQEIVRRLAPTRADEAWPRLQVDQVAAQRFGEAADAFDRRDWASVVSLQSKVVALAPRFGLAHLQLANAEAALGEGTAAGRDMEAALALLAPAPAEVRELLNAQRLALAPMRKVEATRAYAQLVARYPDKASFALTYATLLVASRRPNDALPILLRLDKQEAPLGVRIARLLALASTYEALGDPERMRRSARSAERLARNAGPAWNLETASALLVAAAADSYQYGPRADFKLYDEAARYYESAGNQTGALYARFLGEVRRPPGGTEASAGLSALLAKANAAGYRNLETSILMELANRSLNLGDLRGYRTRMEEAASIAEVTGDALARSNIDVLMMQDDFLRARLDSVDARLRRLRGSALQGSYAVVLDYTEANLSSVRGNAKGAVEALQRARRLLPPTAAGQPPAAIQAELDCTLADLRLSLGDLARAREDVKRCAQASARPAMQARQAMLLAAIDRLAGDRESARARVHSVETMVHDMPAGLDRWGLLVAAAQQLTRLGEGTASDALLKPVAAQTQASGYTLLTALIETGFAENAAARGDWTASRRHAAAAQAGTPEDLWATRARLDLLKVMDALASGDRARGIAMAGELHEQAAQRNDVGLQLELYSLLPAGLPEDAATQDRLQLARMGMRGANVAWMRQRR